PEPEPTPEPEPEPTPEPSSPDTTTGGESSGGETSSGDSGTSSSGSGDGGTSSDSGSDTGASDSGDDAGDDEADDTGSSSDTIDVDTVIVVDGGLTLNPDGDTFDAIAGTETTVIIDVDGDAEEVRVLFEGEEYVLTPDNGTYATEVTVPATDSALTVEVEHADGTVERETYFIDVRGSGSVYEVVDGERTPVGGAVVTVYEIRGGARVAWDASLYGASNPVTLGDSGAFAWYVPNGTYIVSAGKSGYEDGTSGQIAVRDHILAPSIELMRLAEDDVVPEDVTPVATSSTPVAIAVAAVASVAEAVEAIREIPEVQVAADIAAPTTVVLAGTSVAVLASSFNLLPFLQYLFTSPILFFARRKRKAFGTVYNAATKLPVDLAIIRLFAMPEHRLVRSVVTDQKGKYLLSVAPGTYAIEVTKPGFAFPSAILKDRKDDGVYLDVYTGQEIVVTEKDAVIAANIPLDPANDAAVVTPRDVALKRFLRAFQQVVAIVGIMLAAGVFIITPSWFAGIMCAVQVGVYLLVRRLAKGRKPKGWGIVYDKDSREPVGNAVVRLFEPTYNKLVETVLTDRFGRYAFLVGPSEYYVTYSKPGYTEKMVKPIDYRGKQEPTALALDVPIEEAKGDV
ncbi:carboxypeptidase regulatory-like domain-containing protein, partial [Candidatus Uhrbacteria bacterium]|nr:carboxypeptidase regulatory-like domain-containing protein [Candidatus Uhrbacteria bacterium]